jgi:hypothetical protein
MKKTIIIFGGGVSGLTVAHELIEKGFNVKIYEKDNSLGGMARSRRELNGTPSEHSWRGYGPFYKNFFELSKRIPTENNKTVYNNLSLPIDFYLLRDEISTLKPEFTILDWIIVFYYGLKYLTSNLRRDDYYKTKLIPLVKNKLSQDGYDKLIEFAVGPGFGLDEKDASYAHFFKVPILQNLFSSKYAHTHQTGDKHYQHNADGNWHEMNKPTSEAWFDPWKKYLQKKGVKIYLNTELVKINYGKTKITSCIIKNKHGNYKILGDEFILCINPFAAENIFKNSRMNFHYNQHRLLNKNTKSNQISFRLGFNKKIKFPVSNIAFVMTNSEFNITWYPQEQYWKDTKLDNDDNIKSLWSGTCIMTYTKGKLYNKYAINLDRPQLINEIIYQILRSKSLQKMMHVNNNFYINKNDIIYSEIWYEYKYKNGIMKSDSKKWVNNVYNQKYRPQQKTNYQNLYIGGSHTKTTIDIWSMEGAVESGKTVANSILNKYKIKPIIKYEHTDPKYFKLLKVLDNILYQCCLPNIIDIFLIIIVIFAIKKLYLKKLH